MKVEIKVLGPQSLDKAIDSKINLKGKLSQVHSNLLDHWQVQFSLPDDTMYKTTNWGTINTLPLNFDTYCFGIH